MELTRRCAAGCLVDGKPHPAGRICPAWCTSGEIDQDQRYPPGHPRAGECISDDVWTIEQLALIGDARRRSRQRDEEPDVSVDLRTDTITLSDD